MRSLRQFIVMDVVGPRTKARSRRCCCRCCCCCLPSFFTEFIFKFSGDEWDVHLFESGGPDVVDDFSPFFFWWLNFISFFLFFWFGSILLSIIDCPLISPLRPRRGVKAQSAKAPRRNLPVRNRFRNRKKKKKERNQTEERKKERKKASERSVTSSSACGRYVDVGIFFCFFLRSFFFCCWLFWSSAASVKSVGFPLFF